MSYLERFSNSLINKSESDNYYEAVQEWRLDHIEMNETEDIKRCLCNKPINELYYIHNINNDNISLVGSICVKKFMKDYNPELMDDIKVTSYNNKQKDKDTLRRRCLMCTKIYELKPEIPNGINHKYCRPCFMSNKLWLK